MPQTQITKDNLAPTRIDALMVEDNPAGPQLCRDVLQKAGFEVGMEIVRTPKEFRLLASARPFQVILAKQTVAGWSGLEVLGLLEQMEKDIPFILLTSTPLDESAVQLLHEHGADFVQQDHLVWLPIAVRRALEGRALREDRLSLEAQLHHSRRLESLGRLAAGAAHDFNNMLTVIQGHVGLLRSAPELRPEMGESLQQVFRATERASKLTSQLLSLSRKHAARLERLDLNEVLTHLSSLLQRTLEEDINIQHSYAPDLPPIQADRSLMEQIILDLALNARAMMPAGGQLVLSTAPVNVRPAYLPAHPGARTGLFVCLSVIDTGCGMNSAALARVFDPSFSASESIQGAGIGLAAVHGIVKQHRGWIEAQSQAGQGSTIKVFLPASTASSRAETSTGAPVRGGAETILVVEDERPVLCTTRNILEHYGYTVLEAASGMEALAIWHQRQNDIALLLTDIVMPVGVSGQELAEQFQPQKPGLKILYTSGYSAEAAARNLELVDGLNFLHKPYDAETLALAVRRSLDQG